MLTALLLLTALPLWTWTRHALSAHRRYTPTWTVTRAISWGFVLLGPLAAAGVVWAVVRVNT